MGCICSCFATVFLWTGELLENVFLAIGEIGSILIRGIFAVLVGLCDVLAAISCCWRVPYDERPDRGTYVYGTRATTNALSLPPTSPAVGQGGVLRAYFTKEGKESRKQAQAARKKQRDLEIAEKRKEREAKAVKAKDEKAAATTPSSEKPAAK